MEDDNKTHLDRLEQKLYEKNPNINRRERTDLSKKSYVLRKDWDKKEKLKEEVQEEEKPVKKRNFFNKILIVAFLFFIVSSAYAAYIFFGGGSNVSGDDVSINIIGPVSIGGGEKLSLDVLIQNNNSVPLEVVDLVVDYPVGTKDPYNLTEDLKRDRRGLGDIAAGSIVRKTIESSLFGEEGDSKEITVAIEYKIPGSSAIFDTKKTFDIALTAAPVRLVASGLKEISSGQVFELDFKISSNTSKTLSNLMVVIDYPFGFNYESANIDPAIDNNIWIFEEFKPGQEEEVTVTGRLAGQNNEDRIFRLNAGVRNSEQQDELGVIFTNVVHDVLIQKPFVNLALSFNGSEDSEVAIIPGESVRGKAVFSNNTNDTIRDLEIEIRLDGAVVDDKSIEVPNGFYRSLDNTIIFNKETKSELAEINPQEKKNLTFSFGTLDLASRQGILKGPQIRVTSSIDGIRTSNEGSEIAIKEEEYKTIKVMSDINVGAYTLYNSGPFTNSGLIPPKVEQPTNYTIMWSISNTSNDLENVQVVSTLPSYMTWNDSSPSTEDVKYDSSSRQIIWKVGNLSAGAGFIAAPKNLYFQVTFLPSVSQIGTYPNLVRNTKITGRDKFTGTNFEQSIMDANTILQDYTDTMNDHHFVVE